VSRVPNHLVATGFEQSGFGSEDLVFTSRLLVVVVDREHAKW
jgi:hypothetical protein